MGKKLPRRVMSMSKRASKLAEDAADLDVMEQLTGTSEDEPMPEPVNGNGSKPSTAMIALGVTGATAVIVALALAVKLMFAGGEPDFNPPGALSREAPAFYQPGDPNDGRMGQGRSPFPDARTETPIILEVACPQGTVHIVTGAEAKDSVCVVGVVANAPTARIDGEDVPATLHCQEDELIGFVGVDTLGCVHAEDVNGVAPAPTPVVPASLPDTGR